MTIESYTSWDTKLDVNVIASQTSIQPQHLVHLSIENKLIVDFTNQFYCQILAVNTVELLHVEGYICVRVTSSLLTIVSCVTT